jgi:6-pyruvoyltetrahydropterin/6-carboxytetrahydropterin synthase
MRRLKAAIFAKSLLGMRMSVIRKAHFNAAHRLFRSDWSMEKNDEVFGLCNNVNFHGHNYNLEVKVTGEVDPETGYVIDLKIVKDIIDADVVERFDHRNLNLDVPDFAELIPTAEHIAFVIYNRIRAALPKQYDLHIKLYETERNIVEYPVS